MRSRRIKLVPRPAAKDAARPANPRTPGQGEEDGSDELLGLAVRVGVIGIYDTDLVRKRTRFSPELCMMLGLPAGTEISYSQASRLFDERDRAAVTASVEAARTSEGQWSGEFRVLRADGKIRWVHIHGRRHYRDTANGRQAVRSIGAVIDITHMKNTEVALRESEVRLRLALEAAQMGTFEADITGSEATVDAQEAKLLGLPEETRVVSANALRENIPVEDLQESDAKLERLQQHGEAYHHEFRLIMPDGSERWLSGHAAIRSNRIFGVNFDVTQRKRAEAALRDSEERLKTLQEEERQRIAQELHDSTSQHLVAASLNLMRLRSKAGSGSDVQLWDEVEESMQEALKELRTFSYLMHPAALHADGLRSTIRQYVGGYADRSGVTVKFKSSPRVDELPFQMQRSLFRIIQEALANVHRHASASHVSIELWRIGRRLYLTIADNGHGVDGMAEGQREPLRPGVGIIGIRARVQQLGGELKIETGTHGTKIQAEVPVGYAPRKAADLG